MTAPILFNEKSTRPLSSFDFIQDPKDKQSKLGTGSFATVKLAQEKKTGKHFALKMINLNPAKLSKADLYYLRTEIQIHRQLDHPNIIKFHDYIQEGLKLYLVLDYAENGNLYNYIQSKKLLTPNEVFHFFYQTCLAIQYIHLNDVFHRDIKPENILIDKDLNIKLCDFGWSAKSIKEKRLTFCGTYEYMAPEVVWKKPYDYRIDIWSLGVLLYELIHKEAPYKGRSLPEITESFSKTTLTFSANVQEEVKDLIQKILKIEPSERISLADILTHPWVKYHLAKREYTANAARAVSPQAKPEPVSSPKLRQNFFMNLPNQVPAKVIKDRIVQIPERKPEQRPRQEQSLEQSPKIQVPTIIGMPKPGESSDKTDKNESRNDIVIKEVEPDLNSTITQMDISYCKKANTYSSMTLPKKLAEKWAFETRKGSNDAGSRKLFEKDIMSPDFNTKLNSILKQLHVTPTAKKSAGLAAGVLSPQNQNFDNLPKSPNQLNSTFFSGTQHVRDNRMMRQQQVKENTHNITYDFSNVSLENFKVKYTPETTKANSRAQVNYSHLRLETTECRREPSQNAHVPAVKANFGGKVKPETVKASFQRYFAFEAGISSQKSGDSYANRTVLNNTIDTSMSSLMKKLARPEIKTGTEAYSGLFSSPSDLQKKLMFKSLENTVVYGKGLNGTMSKDKENRIEPKRENLSQNFGMNLIVR